VKDAVVLGMLVLGFATLVTTHVALSFALLLFHPPRWRGLVALLVPVLAPVWGWREGRRKTTVLWATALVVYGLGALVSRLSA
jgi:hypothetical protein